MPGESEVRWSELIGRYDAALDWLHGFGLQVAGTRFTESRSILASTTQRYPHVGLDRTFMEPGLAVKFAHSLDDALELIHVSEAFARLLRVPVGLKARLESILSGQASLPVSVAMAKTRGFELLVAALFEAAAYAVDLRKPDLWAVWPGEPILALECRRLTGQMKLGPILRVAVGELDKRTRGRTDCRNIIALSIGRERDDDPVLHFVAGKSSDPGARCDSRVFDYFHTHRDIIDIELEGTKVELLLFFFVATWGVAMKSPDGNWMAVNPFVDLSVKQVIDFTAPRPFTVALDRRLTRAAWGLYKDGVKKL